jgi:hypothetical protein
MKRPSFQFYPADWRSNANLRRCSEAARGAWMDILCLLHDSQEYGIARWPLAELARAAGVALKLARELADKTVLKGTDSGPVEFAHTPRHAGKDGDPVRLVDGQGPIWFSSRMVTDEWRRGVSGGPTRFHTKPDTKPRQGDDLGDGATTSSSTSASQKEEEISLRDISAKPKQPRRSLPEDFPAEPDLAWAQQHWLAKGRADLCDAMTEEIQKFRDHHTGKGTKSACWPGSWRTWASNAKGFNRKPIEIRNGKRSSPHEVAYYVARDMCAEILAGGPGEEGGGADETAVALLPARPN